ncbi:hypothetical protein HPB48_005571 [Haemaphysalis longicornis]|uniref:Reverse transcriptase domain-containing protein n=1 Tax=Haemaphysalis longicornis TaxID=44386 RepID=A0A9J6GGF7_HAELO|nr:hypothetical protein HPB48_005571 [Haemaphysalis longicornis]
MIRATKQASLMVFFSAKTHKLDVPFRTIIPEKGTWQAHLSGFLARQLSQLRAEDPYSIQNSEEVIAFLNDKGACGVSGFSIDVKDMYFSILQEELMSKLHTMIEAQGAVAFQNRAGICSDTFLKLLGAYLQSTILCYEDENFIQSSAVCIGFRVAPYLIDAFMAACNRKVRDSLEDERVLALFRYVTTF